MSKLQEYSLIVAFVLLASAVTIHSQDNSSEKESTEKTNAKDILTGSTPEERLYEYRKQKFLDGTLVNFSDSLNNHLKFTIESQSALPFFLDAEGLKGFAPGTSTDPIDDEIRRKSGIPPTVPLNSAVKYLVDYFKKKPGPKDIEDLPIPTDTEIAVLKVLWVEKSATAGEIYAKLDTNTIIFADELQRLLEEMVNKGFLDRKKISPSNEFNFFGLAQIELSAKNRKNKVYLYWPIITRESLVTYLDAKRYLALVSARDSKGVDLKSNDYKSNYQIYLEKKLYRLFE